MVSAWEEDDVSRIFEGADRIFGFTKDYWRNYFAGQAMMGLLCSNRLIEVKVNGKELPVYEAYAKTSLKYANALIAELEK